MQTEVQPAPNASPAPTHPTRASTPPPRPEAFSLSSLGGEGRGEEALPFKSEQAGSALQPNLAQPAATVRPTLNPEPALNFQVAPPPGAHIPACREAAAQPPTVIDAQPLPAPFDRRRTRRTGRIASLPQLQRDMVGRMLWNGVPYKNIVAALDDIGFNVTERNVSNWATGGYLDWRAEQEFVLQNRLDQDHLVDHLRRQDASELPEVGLQAAATRVSQILLQKTARAEDLEANLDKFSAMVDVLCRLNREIGVLQKQRDDSRRSLGRAHDPERIKDSDEISVNQMERFYSDPPAGSELAKPAAPPALPPEPTSKFLAQQDAEEARARAEAHEAQFLATMKAFAAKKAPIGDKTDCLNGHPAPDNPSNRL